MRVKYGGGGVNVMYNPFLWNHCQYFVSIANTAIILFTEVMRGRRMSRAVCGNRWNLQNTGTTVASADRELLPNAIEALL